MGGWVRCLQDEKNRNTLGKKGTFVVHVQYLENSTWQGELSGQKKMIFEIQKCFGTFKNHGQRSGNNRTG